MSPRKAAAASLAKIGFIVWLVICLMLWIGFIRLATDCQAASVQSDAYPVTAQWLSYPDYLERKLYVPGFEDPTCSAGVIWLGGDYYRIPQGVSEFKCYERGEA